MHESRGLGDVYKRQVRDWTGQNPVRVAIDKNERLSKNLNVFNDEARNITISSKNIDFNLPIAKQICDVLFEHKITSIIIEGGKQTLQTFINENLWDEARIFTGNKKFEKGTKAPILKGKLISGEHILNDILKIYRND